MNHDEFIGRVRHRVRPGSGGQAERATRADPTVMASGPGAVPDEFGRVFDAGSEVRMRRSQ